LDRHAVNRRDLLVSFLALGGTVVSRLSHAQRAQRLPTIGFLSLRPTPTNEEWERLLFTVKLKESGWVEGKSIRILRAFAEGRQDRLRALAEDLAHASVDLIYGFGPDAAVHAARATRTIPIVFWGVAWPVEQGLVDSLARPARNVTGPAAYAA
jgi:putative ABC transport system substrate-binding protein